METVQRKVQLAKEKMKPKPKSTTKAKAAALALEEEFTALELEVAEQLICLSKSSASSGTPPARPVASSAASSGGSSSSLRFVNAPPAPPAPGAVILGGCVDWEEDEDHEVAGRQRKVKRYRLISEIYAATEEIGGRGGSCRKNRKKE